MIRGAASVQVQPNTKRPRGLAVEESWWPQYWAEFGDETFMLFDVDIDLGMPTELRDRRLVIVLLISMEESALLERMMWLGERGAPYWWVKPSEFTKLRALAQMPECKYVHYAN